MNYPQTAADLAASLAGLTADRAGARLAPSASPAGDEIALHAALRAREEVLALVRVIASDVAPITDPAAIPAGAHTRGRLPRAEVAEAMRLGREPVVAAFADATGAHPSVPLRTPDTDPATSADPRVLAWVHAGEQTLVAGAQYTRAGGATTDPARWSAAADAAAFAQLLTHLDTDLAVSVRAHALADPAAAGALDRARGAGPALAAAAQDVVDLARSHQPADYAAVELEPHRVVRVDSPAALVRGQRRLASLIAQTQVVSPATISQIISDTERLNVAAAAALRESDPGRAAAARTTVRSLRAAAPHRAALVTELATLTREDPTPALQSRENARYLRAHPRANSAALARAVDHTGAVLTAAAASTRASVASGTWWTSNLVARDQGPLGAYPWQRADIAAVSALLTRLNLAASHHATRAASPAPALAAVRAGPPARETLRAALDHRPAAARPRGPGISR